MFVDDHVPPGYEVDGWASGLKPGLGRAAWVDLRAPMLICKSSAGSSISKESPGSTLSVAAVAGRATPVHGPVPPSRTDARRVRRRPRRDGTGRHQSARMATAATDARPRPGPTYRRRRNAHRARRPSRCMSRRGVPLYGLTYADASDPQLRLRPETVRRDRTAWFTSAACLSGVVLIWVMSFFPSLLAWGRWFAPEQFALAGGGVWLAGGPVLVVLFLLLVAVLARIMGAGQWVGSHLRHQPAVSSVAPSKNGSSARPLV